MQGEAITPNANSGEVSQNLGPSIFHLEVQWFRVYLRGFKLDLRPLTRWDSLTVLLYVPKGTGPKCHVV